MRESLIVGLDVPTLSEAETVVQRTRRRRLFYKIGYQLAFAGGLDFARELACGRQESLPRYEAARHRQYGCQGCREHRQDGCVDADTACLSEGDAGGSGSGQGLAISACSA